MINIEKFLEKYYTPDEPIILACSTGPDSMYILHKILETKFKKQLVVCYFNHKTRPETEKEEAFIEELGKKVGFPVEVAECDFEKIKKLYPHKGFEELAREKRYQFFDAICHIYKSKKIITAHHLDDKIETFFFNLARGSKLTGLINMTEKSGSILRPLLEIEKKDILTYLDENNLEYHIDESNFDTKYSRNKIRNDILPHFGDVNQSYKKNISNIMKYFGEIKQHIDSEVLDFFNSSENTLSAPYNTSQNYFNIKIYFSLSELLQKEIIRYIYYITNNKSTIGLSERNIAEIIRFIGGKNNKTVKEIGKLKMEKDNIIIRF
ncbi:MAG: tRNA lysidine(34) synthetase TilS [Candidatus Gracilibacteria bacterium]|nr:tRNA lysidine(34) synthetase TilS [Candidatus Gracilibacteria bacterium]